LHRHTAEALCLTRASGATTISLTSYPDSLVATEADIALYTSTWGTPSQDSPSVRNAQLAVVDVIYEAMLLKGREQTQEKLGRVARVISEPLHNVTRGGTPLDTEILLIAIRGTHYEMGRQHGLQVVHLRPLIVEAIEARFAQIESDSPNGTVAPLERFESLVREVDPPILEMIRGQAEALELDFDVLLRYDLGSYLRDDLTARRAMASQGCTTWAAMGSTTADGEPLLVKNRDCPLEHLPLQILVTASPAVGYRYIYVSSAGSPGVFSSGMNERGLVVADTYVCSTDIGPGLPDYSLMMHILEEHDTVRSALDYTSSVPRMGRHNLILADAGGDVAVVELGYHNLAIVEAQDGIVVNTNHFVSPEPRDCFVDTNPPPKRGNSFHRYEKVTCELDATFGQIDVSFAQRLMATHDGPLASICRHPMAGSDSATLSTSIFLPAQRTMLFCHGLPCQGHYDDFVL
jgi:predicted choloylglycine hydrolase